MQVVGARRGSGFAGLLSLTASLALAGCSAPPAETGPETERGAEFDVVEATIPEMQRAMSEGRVTSRGLVEAYLSRIDEHQARLNAAITVNPNALSEADRLDAERAAGEVRGPLHGIPVALKDNIHATGMPTTAGAVAFANLVPPYQATLTANLREAGAVVIAKTTLTELANWIASGMPNGFNAIAGFSYNPYDPRPDPREGSDGRGVMDTGGSSSGIGTAASLWAANVGTETSGSILIPSNYTMLVGIKPTLGRVSRHGIVPITAEQDTAGPMARTVVDAALVLGAIESVDPDPFDAATGRCTPVGDYTAFLDAAALAGARVGIPRAYYYDPVMPPGADDPTGGLSEPEAEVMREAIAVLEAAGAVIVDPVTIPSIVDPDPEQNLLLFQTCGGAQGRDNDEGCSVVMKYGTKLDFNAWLDSLGGAAPVADVNALREYNAEDAENRIPYGQAVLDVIDEMDVERDRERFEQDRERDLFLTTEHGIDAALEEHDLDALLFPGWSSEAIGAKSGYPSITVPFGFIANPLDPPAPAGFDPRPRPFGVTFTGTACAEPRLIALAYAFEQATGRRVPPDLR